MARKAIARKAIAGKKSSRIRSLIAGGLAVWLAYEIFTWPDVGSLARDKPKTTAFIQAAREVRTVDWRWVPYHAISIELKHAVVVAEDVSFFFHHGFDSDEIEASLRKSIQEMTPPRGASTITQQVAKNLWLSPSRNPVRKLKEAILTWQLESNLSKKRILEIYLNIAELGPGVFGAEAAAQRYLGKPASALNRQEAAQLAALLSRPKTWRFGGESRGYRQRVEIILRRISGTPWLIRTLTR